MGHPLKVEGATLRIFDQKRQVYLAELPIKVSKGSIGFFASSPETSAFQICLTTEFPIDSGTSKMNFHITFDLDKWIGNNISQLEGLREILTLIEVSKTESLVNMEVWISGSRLLKTNSSYLDKSLLLGMEDVVTFLHRAGEVFSTFGRYKTVPEYREISQRDWMATEILHAVCVRKEELVTSFEGYTITGKLENVDSDKSIGISTSKQFKFELSDFPVVLLEEELLTGPVSVFVELGKPSLNWESDNEATLTVQGTSNSNMRIVPVTCSQILDGDKC